MRSQTVQPEFTVTKQMVRDALTFKGPCGVTELLSYMKLDEEYRTLVHIHLAQLQDVGAAKYTIESGTWTSLVTLR